MVADDSWYLLVILGMQFQIVNILFGYWSSRKKERRIFPPALWVEKFSHGLGAGRRAVRASTGGCIPEPVTCGAIWEECV